MVGRFVLVSGRNPLSGLKPDPAKATATRAGVVLFPGSIVRKLCSFPLLTSMSSEVVLLPSPMAATASEGNLDPLYRLEAAASCPRALLRCWLLLATMMASGGVRVEARLR